MDPKIWQATKGQNLLADIRALTDRARAAGFITTEYILNLAAAELSKDIDGRGTARGREP